MKGMVFNVQRFCLHDGPGIRTTVFLKGCPLNCAWCHNPEGLGARPQLMLDRSKCLCCGACAAVCGRHRIADGAHTLMREGCIACGRCVQACRAGALEIAGYEADVEDIMAVVRRDKPFYGRGGGGLTISGGEPAAQPEFARALAHAAHSEGIGVCVETSGFCSKKTFLELAECVDIFLFDIKETDPERHRAFTGQYNAPILDNLRALNELGRQIVLRCPLIPGFNDRAEHFRAVAGLANELECVLRVEVEPYHPLGESKAARLDIPRDAHLSAHALPRARAQAMCDLMAPLMRVPAIVS
jgi:glycyl-radical enzyme activating protein